MDLTFIIHVAELILVLLIGLYLLYFKSYFNKKGENLANKEDIKDLTETVEDVKHEYSKNIESVKADLALLLTKRSSVFEEEKLSIIHYFTQINTWVWDTLKIEIHEYFHGNHEELSIKIIRFRDAYKQTNVAFSKVQLLIRDEAMVAAGHEFLIEALKLHNFVDSTVSTLKRNLSSEKSHVDKLLKDLGNQKKPIPKNDPVNNYLKDTFQELRLERETLLAGYHEKYMEYFRAVIVKRNVFIDLAKAYLNSNVH